MSLLSSYQLWDMVYHKQFPQANRSRPSHNDDNAKLCPVISLGLTHDTRALFSKKVYWTNQFCCEAENVQIKYFKIIFDKQWTERGRSAIYREGVSCTISFPLTLWVGLLFSHYHAISVPRLPLNVFTAGWVFCHFLLIIELADIRLPNSRSGNVFPFSRKWPFSGMTLASVTQFVPGLCHPIMLSHCPRSSIML